MSGGDAGIKLGNIESKSDINTNNTSIELALAGEHWSYVNNTLHEHGVDEETLRLIGYHYRTAFIHGYKHGVESCENRTEGPINYPSRLTDVDQSVRDGMLQPCTFS